MHKHIGQDLPGVEIRMLVWEESKYAGNIGDLLEEEEGDVGQDNPFGCLWQRIMTEERLDLRIHNNF